MFTFETEKRLIKKVAAGDEKSCRHFIDTYLPLVHRVATRIVGDENIAEDMVQDVFVKIWRFALDFDGKSKITTWVYRITVNTCLDFLKQQNYGEDIDNFEIEYKQDLADVSYIKKQESQAIIKALDYLKAEERTAIVLFYWEYKKINDIAEILNMNGKAVEGMLRRARAKLAHVLKGKV